jgi:hypothetical protein
VLKVFIGIVTAWQDQIGMPKPALPSDVWFTEIESIYKPLVDQIFFAKDTDPQRRK